MSNIQLPLNFIEIGQHEPDDAKIYIKQNVYNELEEYALSDTNNELGTILIGDYVEEYGKMHVIVSDYIEAKYTDASASTLTFTHETWEYVNKEHDKKYSDKKIVGWQHTHPNYGIFLSNYDLFIQDNFFDMPFQIAYVIDPIQQIRGFFAWKNDKTVKLDGFYIYDEVGKCISVKEKEINKNRDKSEENKVGNVNNRLSLAILFLSLLCTVITVTLFMISFDMMHKYDKVVESQKSLKTVIKNQEEKIDKQNEKINSIENDNSVNEETTKEEYKIVIVKQGDNLYKICKDNGLNYEENIAEIQRLNNYIDLNRIDIGQAIKLPISK